MVSSATSYVCKNNFVLCSGNVSKSLLNKARTRNMVCWWRWII